MIGVILASGLSRRLGRNKLLEDIKGKKSIERVVEEVLKIGFSEVILVYKDKEVFDVCKKYNLKFIVNKKYRLGQSESIKIALKNITRDEPYMFFVGDQPLLKQDTIFRIIEEYNNEEDIVIPRVNGKNKMPTVFGFKYKEELLDLKGDIGGRAIVKRNIDKVKCVNFYNELEFIDIDTEEQLEKVLRSYN